jgi:hypothetical protein
MVRYRNPGTQVFDDTEHESVSTDELRGDWDTLVSTGSELVDALANASSGDIIQVDSKAITTSNWLDLDVDDVVVRGLDGQTTITVADGANVGGFRIGSNAATEGVTLKNFEFDGNADNQDQTVKRLHAYITEDTDGVEFDNCTATRTSPHHEVLSNAADAHNSGGSGFTARSQSNNNVYRDCDTYDIGDRGFQLAGTGHVLIRPKTRDGFDRSVSLDVQFSDGSWDGADDVTIDGGGTFNFVDNSEGSFIAVREYAAKDITIRHVTGRGTFRGAIQQDNVGCENWTIENCAFRHFDADISQPGLICQANTTIKSTTLYEDSAVGWTTPVDINGDTTVKESDIDIRNTDQTNAAVKTTGDGQLAWRGGFVRAGQHPTCINLFSGKGHTIEGVTVDEFGDGAGVGAGVRSDVANCKVSDCDGRSANSPRAFIAWDNSSGVCTDNYDRSSSSTHYDFASAPDLTEGNYPIPA